VIERDNRAEGGKDKGRGRGRDREMKKGKEHGENISPLPDS
jgi:hypothetical protein